VRAGCDYYAEHAAGFLADELIETDASRSLVAYQPLGTVLAVMPWNFPFWQAIRCAAPALAAGNTVLLKHASNVPQCALAIERVFEDAGFPEGVFRTLLVGSDAVPDLIADPRVHAVSLTGSDRAGRAVAAHAGKHLKKAVLELGGSDPFIVLADADLDEAVAQGVKSRFQNAGQSCIAAKRFLVVDEVLDDFLARFAGRSKACCPAIPRWRAPRSRRWPATTCATSCTSRSSMHWRTVRPPSPAASRSTDRAPTTRRPSSAVSRPACAPGAKRCSARWRW
jgi:succinate-semialdehyde dehydrogenase / glutarate-semialdehyde dehydrogenase